jgi:hypothetical protein
VRSSDQQLLVAALTGMTDLEFTDETRSFAGGREGSLAFDFTETTSRFVLPTKPPGRIAAFMIGKRDSKVTRPDLAKSVGIAKPHSPRSVALNHPTPPSLGRNLPYPSTTYTMVGGLLSIYPSSLSRDLLNSTQPPETGWRT